MKISYNDLLKQMELIKNVLLTKNKNDYFTEVWFKFTDGKYLSISLEMSFGEFFFLKNLVGKGNALDISESVRDTLIQESNIEKIITMLENSKNEISNNKETINEVIELVNKMPSIIGNN